MKTIWLVEWHGGAHSCRCRKVFASAKAAEIFQKEVQQAIELLGLLPSEADASISEMDLSE